MRKICDVLKTVILIMAAILGIVLLVPFTFAGNENLTVHSDTSTVYVGQPVDVNFSVTQNCPNGSDACVQGSPVPGASLELSGAASGSGVTGGDGNATIHVDADSAGTITVTATNGTDTGTTAITAMGIPKLNLSANVNILYVNVTKNVIFTVTHACGTAPGDSCSGSSPPPVPDSGVTITVTGVATGSGVTAYDGATGTASATIPITPGVPGNVTVTAHKNGFEDGTLIIPADYLPVISFVSDRSTYYMGEIVNLTVTNIGPVAVIPSSFWIKNVSVTTPVYWSPSLGNDTLLPGQSANYTWNQRDNRNSIVPPWDYKAGISVSYHDRPYSNYTPVFRILPCGRVVEPDLAVNSTVGQDVTFNSGDMTTTGRTWNVTWYINGTQVLREEGVKAMSNYTNRSAAAGVWNVTAVADSGCSTIKWSWTWTVTMPLQNCFSIANNATVFTSNNKQAASFRTGNLSNFQRAWNFTWYLNGTQVFNKTGVNQSTYINRNPALGVWNLTAVADSGCSNVTWAWVWTVTQAPPSNSGGGGSSGGGSSGGGGGGGGVTTSEPFANILKFDRQDADLVKNASVSYSFTDTVFSVYQVLVVGKENEETVGLRIEHLKNASALVNRVPPGTVYANENLWIGSKRVQYVVIRFRVKTTWISDNGLETGNVYLLRFSNGWKKLNSKVINTDGTYTYFEARTPGLSSFAVSGIKDTESPVDAASPADSITASSDSAATPPEVQDTSTPGGKKSPGLGIAAAGAVLVLAGYYRKRKGGN